MNAFVRVCKQNELVGFILSGKMTQSREVIMVDSVGYGRYRLLQQFGKVELLFECNTLMRILTLKTAYDFKT